MVSDAELVDRLQEFLRRADLTTTTTAIVRRQLESDFNIDLSERKAFIREQVDLFLSELENENKDEDEEENEVKEVEGEEKEEDEEEEEEEKSGRKRGANKINKEVKQRGGTGFAKVCSLSPQLQEFLRETELARTEVVKRVWAYIREKSLQDPTNKKNILCDERMENLFKVKSIDMFQMNKALSKHIWPLNSEGPVEPAEEEDNNNKKQSAQKEKKPKEKREDSDDSPWKGKRQKGGKGFLAPLQLSDALVKFLGTGENELSRSDAVKRMWNYIKENNLQDPADKKSVICDEKLKELFQVDSFIGFSVSKLLQAHFIKKT